jgi:hypothetical protein
MKHVAGNLLSRWTDFLTTDGEKPWRNRDYEFVDTFTARGAAWNSKQKCNRWPTQIGVCPATRVAAAQAATKRLASRTQITLVRRPTW